MIQKIKTYIMVATAGLMFAAPAALAGATAYAANPDITGSLCTGTSDAGVKNTGNDCTTGQNVNATDSLKSIAATVVNILSIIVGVIAVVMIIVGGLRYITSGGESGKVGSAKNTLIYAIVGLIIVAIAQFIVHYVLNTASNAGLTQ